MLSQQPPPLILTDYCRARDPDLPWGYWMRVEPSHLGVSDEAGRHWHSVREALWCDRLAFAHWSAHQPGDRATFRSSSRLVIGDQCDLLLAVLAAFGRSGSARPSVYEMTNDIWGANGAAAEHYVGWLVQQRLLAPTRGGNELALTDEGLAVMRMLRATSAPPMKAGRIAGRSELGADADPPSGANPHVDLAALRYELRPEKVGRGPGIVLVDRSPVRGRMPAQETVWSIKMPTLADRDALFAWLLARSDRWEAWGGMTRTEGTLSAHLLAMLFAERQRGQPANDAGDVAAMPWAVGRDG